MLDTRESLREIEEWLEEPDTEEEEVVVDGAGRNQKNKEDA